MGLKSDADRYAEIKRSCARIAQKERDLVAEGQKLAYLYEGYGGDTWVDEADNSDIANEDKDTVKAVCAGVKDLHPLTKTTLNDLRAGVYYIEEA